MTEFSRADLSGSRFERVDLTASTFRQVDLSGARFRAVGFYGVTMKGVELCDVDISGELRNLRINGVDVVPVIEAELDRRHPDRAKMRPQDPAGFREAWDVLERLWAGTVERARSLPSEKLHESVDGEWSFIQTLRHLVFATDSWARRAILGDPTPWHPLGLAWDEAPEGLDLPHDLDARPSLDEVMALRRDRMGGVRRLLEDLDHEFLASDTTPVETPGWPPPQSFPVRECLHIILTEEWEHRFYAERDLAALEAAGA